MILFCTKIAILKSNEKPDKKEEQTKIYKINVKKNYQLFKFGFFEQKNYLKVLNCKNLSYFCFYLK